MNTPNNKRRKASQNRIQQAFIQLLDEKELHKISVTDICKLAEVNRTTFYANYIDIYDLADAVQETLELEVAKLYQDERDHSYNSNNFLKLFQHIYENQSLYKTYFKLGADRRFKLVQYDIEQAMQYYNNQYMEYHVEFFRIGLNAVIKMWLENGCKETPEQINEIIMLEYKK